MIAHITFGWATETGQVILGLLVIGGIVLGHLQTSRTKDKVQEVHILVNSQMSAALERIAELEKALGIEKGDPIPEALVT